MKNKSNKSLCLFLLCLITGFFVFTKPLIAQETTLFISEAAVGIGNSSNEFIELYNAGDSPINLQESGIKLKLIDSAGKATTKQIIWTNKIVGAKDYFLFGTGATEVSFDATYSSASLTGIGGVIIADKNNASMDELSWGEKSPLLKIPPILSPNIKGFEINQSGGLKTGQSIERKYYSHPEDNNLDFILQNIPAPQHSNYVPPPLEEKISPVYSNKIRINEILPNPKGTDSDLEWIEFYNPSDTKESLDGWKLQDRDGAEHLLKQSDQLNLSIDPDNYLWFNPNKFGVSLHNSGTESIGLLDPNGNPVSTVSYAGSDAEENVSYNFNGTAWRWSKFLTPGEENIFNNLPQLKDEVPKKVFVDTYADFSAQGSDKDNDILKYTWDFGDGHKSYLQKTRHKYARTGTYAVILKVTDGSEDTLESFEVKVEKFPKLDVKIISLSPNPAGTDTGAEFLNIKNNTKKKINLKNWSIATGTKTLANHPIVEDFFIKPGKIAKLTYAIAKFTLPNTSARIELRYPNGDTASKVKYKSPGKTIPEDALYEKTKSGWIWKEATLKISKATLTATQEISIPATPVENLPTPQETNPEIEKDLGQTSPSPDWQNKQAVRFSLINFGLHINTASAFSAETPLPAKNHFSFANFPAQRHWMGTLLENLNSKIILFLNGLFFAL